MISVLSGYPVTGFSGQISGRKLMDAAAMSVLSGNIIEVSGGMYRANLYDFDVSGNNIGYFFTASGCIPISFSIVTIDATSGHLYSASGVAHLVYSGQLSGQVVNLLSGNQVGVWSGTSVNVFSGSLYPSSGQTYIASGAYIASGMFVNATASVASGSLYLASGSIFISTFASGVVGGGSGNIPSAWGNSGAVTVGQNLDKSGYAVVSGTTYLVSGSPVTVYSGQLSGQVINILSGNQVGIWSGTSTNVFSGSLYPASGSTFIASGPYIASGVFVNAAVTVTSGQVYLASGSSVNLLSGNTVSVYSGSLYPASGATYIASGPYVASGLFVNATASVASGSLYLASGSVFLNTFASGVIGGGSGNLPSSWGNSGAVVTAINLDKSGYILLAGSVSGNLYLASGSIFPQTFSSGTIGTSGNLPSSWGNSGAVVVGINLDKSGYIPSSGQTYIASGPYVASGMFVNATTTIASGTTFLASGQAVNLLSGNIVSVYSGSLYPASGATFIASGPYIASGIFVNATATLASGQVFLASGSAVNLLSGNQVSIYSGQLSGFAVTPLSGQTYVASGAYIASGMFVNATASVASGSLYLASGSIFTQTFASGVIGGGSGNLPSAWGNSGAVTVGQDLDKSGFSVTTVFDKSGYTAATISGSIYPASGLAVQLLSGQTTSIYSGQLSGQAINLLSGNQVGVWSGTQVNAFSGASVTASLYSGQVVNLLSGQAYIASGLSVIATVYSGQLSGFAVTPLSGQTYIASGAYVASGISVVATASVASGSLYLASGSIFSQTFASGVLGASGGIAQAFGNSGNVVTAVNLDKSGYTASLVSGQQVVTTVNLDKSGYTMGTNLDKSGYTLSSSGLDPIPVESGLNFRQAMSINSAVLAGRLSGAGTNVDQFGAANTAGTPLRLTASVDFSGNRTNITLNIPV